MKWWSFGRGGAVAMAALAVVSLGATVATSRRALADASDLIARGQGDVVLSAIASELAEETQPPSAAALARVLAAHDAEGLRYLAFVDREGHSLAEAGHATIPATAVRPGMTTIVGRRARVVGFPGPPHGISPDGHLPDGRLLDLPPPPPGPHLRIIRRVMPGLVVVELEPPMIATLQHDLARIAIVAAIASIVLLAFAFAWSRSARRLTVLEARAVREQRLVALGSMSSVMAHELRNPLASLKGHAQLLVEDLEGDADAKRRTKAARVVAEAERLEVLTTSLLDFVRDGPIERDSVTPRAVVERALVDLDAARVDIELGAAPSQIDVDHERLSRALHNLVDNALKAGGEGRVMVEVTTADGASVFRVRDRGPGIPVGDEARIFEPFVTTRVRGTGLGLAVARRIAEQHGGTLDGETHPEGGAVFELRVPVTSA